MEKLIITVAPVGAEVTRNDNPHLPLTPEEIAMEAERCRRAGASIAHIHARDKKGCATQDREVYRQIIDEVKKRTDIIVQVSTGGAVGMKPEERIAPVSLRPEMCTLTTGTCNFGPDVFMNTLPDIEFFCAEIRKYGVLPEMEIFDYGMISNALNLIKKELVPRKVNFDFVLGVPGALMGSAKALVVLSEEVPKDCTWTVAGIGRFELPLAVMAITMGGNVRVGFEDNIYYSKGVPAESNAQLVERIVRIARECGREVATPGEARSILGLKG
ncbi:MAG: 3-keto-5-aminohexanoate cleavage protein [Candidatus Eremiobacteraeota bacterium]|nr:3-keto-5-aminohexanoate cleavage protein [Candidatus Eremiobacteraeota bacterium]